MTEQTIGFFALWNNKPSEYHADQVEQQETLRDIQGAFDATVANGTRIFTQFETRWSAERQYVAYWECPSFEVLESAMNHLEAAGDFKFAESEHIIGIKIKDEFSREISPDLLQQGDWFGCFIAWKWTDAYYTAKAAEKKNVKEGLSSLFRDAERSGMHIFGQYHTRGFSRYDRFTYVLFPDFMVYEKMLDQAETLGVNKYARIRFVLGKHNPVYRFARELQL